MSVTLESWGEMNICRTLNRTASETPIIGTNAGEQQRDGQRATADQPQREPTTTAAPTTDAGHQQQQHRLIAARSPLTPLTCAVVSANR